MELPGPLSELLKTALLDAFTKQSDLNDLVRIRLDTNPGVIFAAGGETLEEAVGRLIKWSEEYDRVGSLLVAACEKRGSNQALLQAKEKIAPLLAPGSLVISTQVLATGMQALRRLMDNPAVRAAVERLHQDITSTGDRLLLVSAYKTVHDTLHDLQLQCYDQLAAEIAGFPDDDVAYDNIENHFLNYRKFLQRLREVAVGKVVPANEMRWVGEFLDKAEESWSKGLEQRSKELVREAEQLLKRVLAFYPTKINTSLDRAVGLMLPTFVETLRQIAAALPEQSTEDELRFRAGLDRLESLTKALSRLVDVHNRWQEIENELHRIAEFVELAPDPVEHILISWPILKESLLAPSLIDPLEPAAAFLHSLCAKLDEAIGKHDPARTKDRFRKLRSQGRELFYDVDKRLKSQCDELPSVAGQLEPLLRTL